MVTCTVCGSEFLDICGFWQHDCKALWLKRAAALCKPCDKRVEAEAKAQVLPTDAKERKSMPICTGVLDYFPDALAEVAKVSVIGNNQHNPGQPLHWEKSKSTDHADCILRHLADRGKLDTDGARHSAKVAWRALALLQTEIENERKAKGQ